jgi:hypothetical protein
VGTQNNKNRKEVNMDGNKDKRQELQKGWIGAENALTGKFPFSD